MRGGGGGNDHIDACQNGLPFIKLHSLPAHFLRELFGAVKGAVRHEYSGSAPGHQGLGGLAAGIAGADDNHPAILEMAKNLFGQIHRNTGHRCGTDLDIGVGPHLLSHTKSLLEKLVQGASRAVAFKGRLVSLLDLPENLRFPQNHGVESRHHATQMTGRLRIPPLIEVLLPKWLPRMRLQERAKQGTRRPPILRCRIVFRPVAG